MAANFKRITALLERWPLDHNKAGRDIGQFLRDFVQHSYKTGKLQENPQHWDKQFLALQRLINNEHGNKYPRINTSSATGLTLDQCTVALSNEFLEHLEQEDKPVYKKLFSSGEKTKEKE